MYSVPRNDLHQMSGPEMVLFLSPQTTKVNSTSADTRSFHLRTIVLLFFNGPVPHRLSYLGFDSGVRGAESCN